jgi:hypothetical protein
MLVRGSQQPMQQEPLNLDELDGLASACNKASISLDSSFAMTLAEVASLLNPVIAEMPRQVRKPWDVYWPVLGKLERGGWFRNMETDCYLFLAV